MLTLRQALPADTKFFRLTEGSLVEVEDGLKVVAVVLTHNVTRIQNLQCSHDEQTGRISDIALRLQELLRRWEHTQASIEPNTQLEAVSHPECVICKTEQETPNTLECGHVYCHDCLEGLCNVVGDASDPGLFVQCAHMDEGLRCAVRATTRQIKRLLSPEDFAALLQGLAHKHIRRHPEHYGHCATPDCEFIFQKQQPADFIHDQKSTASIICDQCNVSTCLRCGHQHSGVSCAAFKANMAAEQAEVEEWRTARGLKACPTCEMAIEKGIGCNHVECEVCHSHICWKCGKGFPTAKECIDHLAAVCGGIFPNGFVAVEEDDRPRDEMGRLLEDWEEEPPPFVPWGPEHNGEPPNRLWHHHGVQGNTTW